MLRSKKLTYVEPNSKVLTCEEFAFKQRIFGRLMFGERIFRGLISEKPIYGK